MIRTETTVRMLQAVAAIAALAVLLWSLGLPMTRMADAANLTYVKNTLSDSGSATVSNHEIEYVIPAGSAGVESGESVVVTFPNGFNISTSGAQLVDYDFEIDNVDQTVVLSGAGASDWTLATSGQTVTFTSGGASATIGAGATVTVKIGSNADGGTARVDNHHATGSYEFSITSGDGVNNDTGNTIVAITDEITVSASVDTLFTFSVSGVTAGSQVNGTTTTGNTSAVAIPFGNLEPGVGTTSAQRLFVTTNARYGFTVSVQTDTELVSATGADINGFANGSYQDTPIAWSRPTALVGTPDTYGHWGITTTDYSTGATNEFSANNQWVSPSTTQPRIVMGHTGPADGDANNIGSTTVGYKVQISSLQEAADDYQTTLTYIATPVF